MNYVWWILAGAVVTLAMRLTWALVIAPYLGRTVVSDETYTKGRR